MKEHENKPEHYKDITVQIEGPFGELTLRKELSRYEHVVFIGGGIGVTPLDSMYNQLVTDLLDNKIRHGARTRKIDFIFTTRSRSLVTEFASRNKAWEYFENCIALQPMQNGDTMTPNIANEDEAHRRGFSLPQLPEEVGLQTTISFHGDKANIREMATQLSHSVTTKQDTLDRQPYSLRLNSWDKEVGSNKPKHMIFNNSTRNSDDTGKLDAEFDDERSPNLKEAFDDDMAVDSLEIFNSTHITRVKDAELRREYKQTYPFINFQRPNIREIIYKAASDTHSKDICILTSGPKGMINECKRWAAEIGVDVHSEVFDW